MSTALVSRVTSQEIQAVEDVAAECRKQLVNRDRPFAASFAIAAAIRQLQELITPAMMQDIMALQGNPLGFKTDKDRDKQGNPGPGYTMAVVKDAYIEATARGFRPVNNEWNIIAGRFYGAKAGFGRLVKTFPGLADFVESISVPEHKSGVALVSYVASWTLNGEAMQYQRSQKRLKDGTPFDDRIVVKVHEGYTSDDAVHGKAYRKAYAGIYDLLLGNESPTPEGEVEYEPPDGRGAPKVGRSALFAPPAPVEQGLSEADQQVFIQQYARELNQCTSKTTIGIVAKRAGMDQRLTTASRKAIADLCTRRAKALASGEPPYNPPTAAEESAAESQVDPAVEAGEGLDEAQEPQEAPEPVNEDAEPTSDSEEMVYFKRLTDGPKTAIFWAAWKHDVDQNAWLDNAARSRLLEALRDQETQAKQRRAKAGTKSQG